LSEVATKDHRHTLDEQEQTKEDGDPYGWFLSIRRDTLAVEELLGRHTRSTGVLAS